MWNIPKLILITDINLLLDKCNDTILGFELQSKYDFILHLHYKI